LKLGNEIGILGFCQQKIVNKGQTWRAAWSVDFDDVALHNPNQTQKETRVEQSRRLLLLTESLALITNLFMKGWREHKASSNLFLILYLHTTKTFTVWRAILGALRNPGRKLVL